MIIKLFEAGDEIKSYDNFNSIELQAILKDNNLDGLSSKYELKFFGNGESIIRALIYDVFIKDDIFLIVFNNDIRTIDNVKCNKHELFASIFELLCFRKLKCKISYFDRYLKISFDEIKTDYFIRFVM